MCAHYLVPKEVLPEICPQLKQLRLEQGLSLEELQAIVHISPRLLKRMEDGKCLVLFHLIKLLDFYGKKVRIALKDKN